MKHTIPASSILNSKKVLQLDNGQFLLPIERHGSDDYCTARYWHERGTFHFSANIKVIAATYIQAGGAVIVEKIDPSIPETIEIYEPGMNGSNTITITF